MLKTSHSGFTLVELMIAIVLGLLIVAAATQLFITGVVSVNLQKAMADIQDNSNFGINYITNDLRKVNYNAEQPQITSETKYGGVILKIDNFPSDLKSLPDITLLSKSAAEDSTKQLTNVPSDQLTVQFYTDLDSFDCEGNMVLAGNMVVQRYFIQDNNLKCDAASYLKGSATAELTGMNSNAQILLKNVEYMRILLAVSEDKIIVDNVSNDPLPANKIVQKSFRYMSIGDYPTNGTLPRVRGIQLGLLVRANDAISPSKSLIDTNKAPFRVLDQDIELKTPDSKYLRQVVTQTIALRNAMGASS